MNQFFYLSAAILAEVVATSALKMSDGFTKLVPAVVTTVGYGVAFYLLSLSLRRMELGVVYAIWSGLGTAATALVGYWLFSESLSPVKLVSIGLIVVGVMGLYLGDSLLRPAQ